LRILLHILFVVFSSSIYALNTKKIEIINADSSFASNKLHPDYLRLIGNVTFKHNNAFMYCDSAYHYLKEQKIIAFGNIKISQADSLTLVGKKLTFYGKKEKAEISGNVSLSDNFMILKTEKIFYDFKHDIANYPKPGKIYQKDREIKSKKGNYFSRKNKFIFTDSVLVTTKNYNITTDNMHYNSKSKIYNFFGPSYLKSENKTIYCENGWYDDEKGISQFQQNAHIISEAQIITGDSIYYDENQKYGKILNNAKVEDTIENVNVYGNFIEYFENKKIAEITKKPILEIILKEDTLFMHAKKFVSHQKIKNKKVLAYNKVKFFKKNLQGKCDSLSYNFNDSIIEMYRSPVIWSKEYQITSDSIRFQISNGEIEKMILTSNPIIIEKLDSLNYNQIKGKNMIAFFDDDQIKYMDVNGNGQSIFFIDDENKDEKIGLNFTECSDLFLLFDKNNLQYVNYKSKPISKTIPINQVTEKNRFLKGFKCRIIEKPVSKNDIFN
tara:strand:- start:392 stop:1882 length:1491 start_codon:yes stop_codon:yes gene_type:complete